MLPSGHEEGSYGSHVGVPPVHRHPSAVHSHHSSGGHEYGSPTRQSSVGWHVQTSPSQKHASPEPQAPGSRGSQPAVGTHEQLPQTSHSHHVPTRRCRGRAGRIRA